MKFEEVKDILTILRVNYPNTFRNMEKEDMKAYLNLWAEAFKEDPAEMVVKAVKSIIYADTREFAPNIGQVKSEMFKFYKDAQTDVNDAWQIVLRNAKCDIAQARKNYEALPANIQKVISPAFLSELGYSNVDQVGYKRNEFERKYNMVLEREKELFLSGEISVQQLGANNTQPRLETGLKSVKALLGGTDEKCI